LCSGGGSSASYDGKLSFNETPIRWLWLERLAAFWYRYLRLSLFNPLELWGWGLNDPPMKE
jgi:hypothetical protein